MIDIATGAYVRKFYGLVQKDYHLNAFFGGANEEFVVSGSEGKKPIRTRYWGHVTGYQPIREQYFFGGANEFAVSGSEGKIQLSLVKQV